MRKTETGTIIFLFCFCNVKLVNRDKLAAMRARRRLADGTQLDQFSHPTQPHVSNTLNNNFYTYQYLKKRCCDLLLLQQSEIRFQNLKPGELTHSELRQ